MTSFEFDISQKDLAGAQFISKVGRRLISAFVKRMRDEKITKKQLADLLEVDKSTVSRMLRGDANLTARTIGEISWALDIMPDLSLSFPDDDRSNIRITIVPRTSRPTYSITATPQPKITTMASPKLSAVAGTTP